MPQQTHTTPGTGLQSFAESSPDYELAPVGIASMRDQAQQLAEYGRHGDIYIVHAAEGETVVPLEVLNANPKVKELLFNQMSDMGMDPQEFVVGNELNSINPDTGLPEFFFSRIFRAINKGFKAVTKVVKKWAPIVVPIAAAAFGIPFLAPAFFGAGTVGASFLGSGIGTLLGGGNLKDALKSGLVAGATTGVMGGLSEALQGDSANIFENLQSGAMKTLHNPTVATALSPATAQSRDLLLDSILGSADAAVARGQPALSAVYAGAGDTLTKTDITAWPHTLTKDKSALTSFAAERANPYDIWLNDAASRTTVTDSLNAIPFKGDNTLAQLNSQALNAAQSSPPIPTTSSWDNLVDIFQPGGKSAPAALSDLLLPGPGMTVTEYISKNPQATLEQARQAVADASPGLLEKWLPLATGLGTVAYAAGAFDQQEEEPVETLEERQKKMGPTGAQLYAANPDRYNTPTGAPQGQPEPQPAIRVPTQYAYQSPPTRGGLRMWASPQGQQPTTRVPTGYGPPPTQYAYQSPPAGEWWNTGNVRASQGGPVSGPGTGTSDSIPARLSDGEFVMTAEAVRNAGGGDRSLGAARMYDMMRNFEMGS